MQTELTASINAGTHEAALIANPLPWKARSRATGSKDIRSFPWEVFDANGMTVALCATSMAASLMCAAARAATDRVPA